MKTVVVEILVFSWTIFSEIIVPLPCRVEFIPTKAVFAAEHARNIEYNNLNVK